MNNSMLCLRWQAATEPTARDRLKFFPSGWLISHPLLSLPQGVGPIVRLFQDSPRPRIEVHSNLTSTSNSAML
jgi:hypothetical protein